jgi:hypothetical protein
MSCKRKKRTPLSSAPWTLATRWSSKRCVCTVAAAPRCAFLVAARFLLRTQFVPCRVLLLLSVCLALQIILYGSMMGLLAILTFAVFLPILNNVENSKDTIVIRFIELPAMVKRTLHAQAQRRFKALRSQYVNDDDSGEESGSGDDSDDEPAAGATAARFDTEDDGADFDWKSMMRKAGGSAGSVGSSHTGDYGGGDNPALRAAAQPSRSVSTSKNGRAYRKSSWSFLALLGKFVGPLLALCIFFTVIYATSTVYAARLLTLASISTSATSRALCARSTVVDIKRFQYMYADRNYIDIHRNQTLSSVDCVEYWQHL